MLEPLVNKMVSFVSGIVLSISGECLTFEEKDFLQKEKPAGIILMGRNCKSPQQVKDLVTDLKGQTKNQNLLVLIDQEGGSVARLRDGFFEKEDRCLPAEHFGNIAKEKGIAEAASAVKAYYAKMGSVLKKLGINVNCAPVCDLQIEGAHRVIGDRSFSSDVSIASSLAIAAAEGLWSEGVTPVIKHIPGHGRAKADSHEELPQVETDEETLLKTDFEVFRLVCEGLKSSGIKAMAMTAHIVYKNFDDALPATQSTIMIDLIRNQIGFDGPIISDCISMNALSENYYNRSLKTLQAGCNYVLYCSGKNSEMEEIARAFNDYQGEQSKQDAKRRKVSQ